MEITTNTNGFFIVTVQDQVIQITDYIVRAKDIEEAKKFVYDGIFAFESSSEVIDTIESSVKSVEAMK